MNWGADYFLVLLEWQENYKPIDQQPTVTAIKLSLKAIKEKD